MRIVAEDTAAIEYRTNERYVVVDLPIRITDSGLAQLTAAANRARLAAAGHETFAPINLRVAAARERASEILQLRKNREAAMGADLFGEPAWDMMLDLFIQHVDGRRTSTTSAAIASRAPPTTGLRYLNTLVRKGLVEQNVSNHDLRIQYVSLSETGYARMLDLLSQETTFGE